MARAAQHNHQHCIEEALLRAEALCATQGARLTPLRRRVLELIWRSHSPVGAYDLLALLQKEQTATPPTVYRALEFLQAQGLVHRIASRNAYLGCAHPGDQHSGQFLLCRACGDAVELEGQRLSDTVNASAKGAGFRVERMTVEIEGLCKRCVGATA